MVSLFSEGLLFCSISVLFNTFSLNRPKSILYSVHLHIYHRLIRVVLQDRFEKLNTVEGQNYNGVAKWERITRVGGPHKIQEGTKQEGRWKDIEVGCHTRGFLSSSDKDRLLTSTPSGFS